MASSNENVFIFARINFVILVRIPRIQHAIFKIIYSNGCRINIYMDIITGENCNNSFIGQFVYLVGGDRVGVKGVPATPLTLS